MSAPPVPTARTYWEHFPHQADIGVRGVGPDLATAFAQAALALTATIAEADRIAPTTPVEITAAAADPEDLLFDWLNALIFEMATRGILFSRFDVAIADGHLSATAWGEAVSVGRHQPTVEVKGATYTGLRVFQADNGDWVAECIIDV